MNSEKVLELIKLVNAYEPLPPIDEDHVVLFSNGGISLHLPEESELNFDKIERINGALRNIPKDRKPALTFDLYDALLEYSKYREPIEHMDELFGDYQKHIYGIRGRIMATLTANDKQFRVWYAVPGDMRNNYVDSCGKGLLIHVRSDDHFASEFAREFLNRYKYYSQFTSSSGYKVFLSLETNSESERFNLGKKGVMSWF